MGYFAETFDECCFSTALHPFTFNLQALVRFPSRTCVAIWGTGATMSSLSPFFTFSHSNPLPFLSSSSSALHSRHARYIGVGVCLSREGEKQRTGQMFNFGCVSAVRIRSLSLSFVFGAATNRCPLPRTQRLPPSLSTCFRLRHQQRKSNFSFDFLCRKVSSSRARIYGRGRR